MKIAISGAGIAGPTLAHWLLRAGHQPTLIEHSPTLRTGGYVVDFWGVGYTIAERMGILPKVREAGYLIHELRCVDEDSRRLGGFMMDTLNIDNGRYITISRSQLAALIYESIAGEVRTIFGDSIASLEEHETGVRVGLASGVEREFDLVIGADGLHSNVRKLVFGPEEPFEKDLGYRVAAFEVNGYTPRDELIYIIHASTSHQIARFAVHENRTLFLFVFRAELAPDADPRTQEEIRSVLHSVFGDMKWEVPQILQELDSAGDIYYDRVSQIRMDTWHKGRVMLIGDAAAAVSLLAGEGTGLAMAEAYTLAGELGRAGDNYAKAFDEYENMLRPFIVEKQEWAVSFASTFVPDSEFGLWMRNQSMKLMNLPGIGRLMLGRMMHDNFELKDYFTA